MDQMDVPIPSTSVDYLATSPAESVDKPKRNLKRELSSDEENIEGPPNVKAARKSGPNKKHRNLPPDLLEEKRLRANEQERVRQKQIADALDVLKSLDMPYNPNLPNHKEDSKLYTICTASAYIAAMTKMIKDHDNGIINPEQILVPPLAQGWAPPNPGPMIIYSDPQTMHMVHRMSMQPVASWPPHYDQQRSSCGEASTGGQMYPTRRALVDTTNHQQGSFCHVTGQPLNSRINHQNQMPSNQQTRHGHGTPSRLYHTTHEVMSHQPVASSNRSFPQSTSVAMSYASTPDRYLKPNAFAPSDPYLGLLSPVASSYIPGPSVANMSPVGSSILSPPSMQSTPQYFGSTPLHSKPQYNRGTPRHSTPQYYGSTPLYQHVHSPSAFNGQTYFSSPPSSLTLSQTESGYGSSFASGSSGNNSNISGGSYSNMDSGNHANSSVKSDQSFLNLSHFQQPRFTQ